MIGYRPMFSGKSSLLQARIRRFKTLKWKTIVLTSSLDTRHGTEVLIEGQEGHGAITTHDGIAVPAVAVSRLMPVIHTEPYQSARAVLLEEAQFFPDLLDFVLHAVEVDGKDVVVVGLNSDRDRRAFGQVLDVAPYADIITKLTSLCCRCGDGTPALFSSLIERHDDEPTQIHVGGAGVYEPMCRKHFLHYRNMVKSTESA